MCQPIHQEDLAPSRLPVTDYPALLFFHQPVRCRECGHRYFAFYVARAYRFLLPKLWMHYLLLLLIVALVTVYYEIAR